MAKVAAQKQVEKDAEQRNAAADACTVANLKGFCKKFDLKVWADSGIGNSGFIIQGQGIIIPPRLVVRRVMEFQLQ